MEEVNIVKQDLEKSIKEFLPLFSKITNDLGNNWKTVEIGEHSFLLHSYLVGSLPENQCWQHKMYKV